MNAVGLYVPRQGWRLQGFVVVLLVLGFFLHALVLPAAADAAPYITRGEIMSRAFSALDTTYNQAGTHPKSWKPNEVYSEPQVDCSGLVQKSWQVPEQIYYGRWNEGTSPTAPYSATDLAGDGPHWGPTSKSALLVGDCLASASQEHATLYVYTDNYNQWHIIDASGIGVKYRTWPYDPAAYNATRRDNVSSGYTIELDNPTAWQIGGPVTYTYGSHTCNHFQDWSKSSQIAGFLGLDYQHQWGTASGTLKRARFTPRLFETGFYYVDVRWPQNSTYATNAKVIIMSAAADDSWRYVNRTQGGNPKG